MNDRVSQASPKKKSKRFLPVLAAVLLLAVAVTVLILDYLERVNYGPGPIEIEVNSNKPSYIQGEKVNFTIYVNSPQNWPVPQPSGVTYEINKSDIFVFGSNKLIEFATGVTPVFPAHSRTFYETFGWDCKVGSDDNRTLAPPGIYTLTVTFGGLVDYGNGGNCTFEIR